LQSTALCRNKTCRSKSQLQLSGGWTPQIAYQFFGGVLVVAGIAVILLDWTYRGRSENPDMPEA
jgi:hypothetical protein